MSRRPPPLARDLQSLNKDNSLLPISQLPSELLLRIFLHAAHRSATEARSSVMPCPDWAAVTQVCGSWRTIALGSPGLWFDIFLGYTLPWLETIFKRSKGHVALDVLATCGCLLPAYVPLFRTILSEPSRLRSLELTIQFGEIEGIRSILSKMGTEAPLLEKLLLINETAQEEAGFILPENIFGGDTPRLRNVDLRNCALASWDSPFLSGLTHLTLRQPLPYSNYSLPGSFLGALQRMPNLQELVTICYPFDIREEDAIVGLPHLQKLEVVPWSGNFIDEEIDDTLLARLLRHIQIPCTARLDLNANMCASSAIDFGQALRTTLGGRATTDTTARFSGVTLTSLDITYLDSRYLAVNLGGRTAGSDQEVFCSLGLITDYPSTALLRNLLDNLPLAGLRSITLYALIGERCMSGYEFTSIRSLPHLRSLTMSGAGIRHFLKPPEGSGGDSRLSFDYPALECLSIACVDVHTTESEGIPHEDQGRFDMDHLIALVAGCKKKSEGGKLKEVAIRRCDIDPQDMPRLEEACGPGVLIIRP